MPIVILYLPDGSGWTNKSIRLERVPSVGDFLAVADDAFYVVRAVVHHLDSKDSDAEVFVNDADRHDMLSAALPKPA